MPSTMLQHPVIAAGRQRLVAAGSGVLLYDFGCGGWETAVTVGADLARRNGTDLHVVDAAMLHVQVTAVVAEVAPGITVRCLSPQYLVRHPDACRQASVLVLNIGHIRRSAGVSRILQDAVETVEHPVLSLHPYELRDTSDPAAPVIAAATLADTVIRRGGVLVRLDHESLTVGQASAS